MAAEQKAAAAAGVPMVEPIPAAGISEITGLLEIVNDHNGRMDAFAVDALTDYDFGHTLEVVKAGEMLGLLETPKNLVVVTDLGRRFLHADIPGRKEILNAQLRELGTFSMLIQALQEAPGHHLPTDVIQEELVMRLPSQDVERTFQTVLNWARFAELFTYESEADGVGLIVEVFAG